MFIKTRWILVLQENKVVVNNAWLTEIYNALIPEDEFHVFFTFNKSGQQRQQYLLGNIYILNIKAIHYDVLQRC